nr:hybrid signal transduction histidine kinase M [Tanacetum cinerariifolium]
MIKLMDQTMDAYFRKIVSITNVLTKFGSPMNNHDVVTYALHGLSDKYEQVMGIIPHRDPFPDLKAVRSIITEETRLNSKSQPLFSDTYSSSLTILLIENTNVRRRIDGRDARSSQCSNEP